MANDNIFQQYLAPAKSIADYSAEYDAADSRKQSLAQNALALATGQQKFGETQQATQRAAQLRAVLTGLPTGATDDDRIKAMRGAGSQEGFAAADALEKSLVERRKGMAAAGKDEGETADKAYKLQIAKHDQALRDMSSFQSPQEAMQSLQQHVASGELPPEQAQMFAAQLQSMNPADFPKWQLGMVQRLMSAKDDMSFRAPDANNVATNARVAAEGAANRANTAGIAAAGRAQSDRHFNTTQEAGKTQVIQSDSGPLLVNTKSGAGKAITGPDGQPLAGVTKPLNDSQSKALLFGTRMQEAHKMLGTLAGEGTDTSVPGARSVAGGVINYFSSGNHQMLDQAKRDFLNADLRRESGASISDGEFENGEKQYFPQPGDKPEVKAQKARNRELAYKGILAEVPEKQRASITPAASPVAKPKPGKDIHAEADAILRGDK